MSSTNPTVTTAPLERRVSPRGAPRASTEGPRLLAVTGSHWLALAIGIAGFLAIAFVLLYRVGTVPHIWYDEGAHMHVAKNLAVNGIYADYSSEGDRYTGPVLGVGPTVVVPIAVLFKLFGSDIGLGRLVVALYALGAVVVGFLLCRNLVSAAFAALTVVVMVSMPEFMFYGRSVLGEIPGLFYVLAALYVWLTPGRTGYWRLVGAGVLFGLACITKNQYAVIVLPSLFIAWIADMLFYRARGWLYFVIPGAVATFLYVGWMAFVLFVHGSDQRDVWADFEVLRATSEYVLFRWHLDNLKLLYWTFPTYSVLCAVAFPLWLLFARRKHSPAQSWDTLLIFTAIAGTLYLSSAGWLRYALPATILAAPFVALALYHAAVTLGGDFPGAERVPVRARILLKWGGAAAVTIFVGVIFVQQASAILAQRPHDDAIEMASFLEANAPPGAVIETIEQEFAILTERVFHYPPQALIVTVTAEWTRRGRTFGEHYDHVPYVIEADYVLSNSSSYVVSSDFYSPARLTEFESIHAIGEYVLYRRTARGGTN